MYIHTYIHTYISTYVHTYMDCQEATKKRLMLEPTSFSTTPHIDHQPDPITIFPTNTSPPNPKQRERGRERKRKFY
jgi:hypothetical protein